MELGHVLTPTLGISKLTWQNSHWKQNIFLWLVLTGFETFLTCFDRFWYLFDMFWHFFDTFWHFFDRQTDRWTEGQTSLSYMTCFDTFWHVLTLFWQFLTFFDIFLTDQLTEPSFRSSVSRSLKRKKSKERLKLKLKNHMILWYNAICVGCFLVITI